MGVYDFVLEVGNKKAHLKIEITEPGREDKELWSCSPGFFEVNNGRVGWKGSELGLCPPSGCSKDVPPHGVLVIPEEGLDSVSSQTSGTLKIRRGGATGKWTRL